MIFPLAKWFTTSSNPNNSATPTSYNNILTCLSFQNRLQYFTQKCHSFKKPCSTTPSRRPTSTGLTPKSTKTHSTTNPNASTNSATLSVNFHSNSSCPSSCVPPTSAASTRPSHNCRSSQRWRRLLLWIGLEGEWRPLLLSEMLMKI